MNKTIQPLIISIMKETKKERIYEAPIAECLEIETEQCIAVSPGGDLSGMDPNDLINEFGTN